MASEDKNAYASVTSAPGLTLTKRQKPPAHPTARKGKNQPVEAHLNSLESAANPTERDIILRLIEWLKAA
jgi:hypothetical protein